MNLPAILTLALGATLGASSCTSTAASLDRLNEQFVILDAKVQEQEQALRDAAAVLSDPIATQEQVEASIANVQARVQQVGQAIQETKGALLDVRDAGKADAEQLKARVEEIAKGGLSTVELAGGGSGISLAVGWALWLLRDWRKRKGNDPLLAQLEAKLQTAGNLSATALDRLAEVLAERRDAGGSATYPGAASSDPPPFIT